MHGWRKVRTLVADNNPRVTGIHGFHGVDGNCAPAFYIRLLEEGSHFSLCTLKKRDGCFNLAKVISVAAEWHHVTPTLSFYFSYTLETEGMWAMCRVSPSCCGGLSSRVNDSPLVY